MPYRAGKGWLYEGGILEPTIVKWPKNTMPGSISADLVSSIDFLPTMLEIAGLASPVTDGQSIVSVLKGQSEPERTLFWHYPHYGNQGGSPSGAIRKGPWKLIQFFETNTTELYNLKEDPSESMDVSGVHPGRTESLLAELKRWQDEAGVLFPTQVPK